MIGMHYYTQLKNCVLNRPKSSSAGEQDTHCPPLPPLELTSVCCLLSFPFVFAMLSDAAMFILLTFYQEAPATAVFLL